jgi:hypothetical protein
MVVAKTPAKTVVKAPIEKDKFQLEFDKVIVAITKNWLDSGAANELKEIVKEYHNEGTGGGTYNIEGTITDGFMEGPFDDLWADTHDAIVKFLQEHVSFEVTFK